MPHGGSLAGSPHPAAGLDRRRAVGACAATVGVGLKAQHCGIILDDRPRLDFFEIHAENYMCAGGPPHRYLERIRADYALSVHGVGLSIGGTDPLDIDHLLRLRALIDRYQPAYFSEHLAWSVQDGVYLPDLLPIAYTDATLARICARIDQIQATLGQRMLLENPSTYVAFADSNISEPTFLAAVAARTGCGLLLDVNNVAVSAINQNFDARDYIASIPAHHVGEIHLAGYYATTDAHGRPLRIDTHGSAVAPDVWDLYRHALAHLGQIPTLIEWDNDVPAWPVLYGEARRAEALLALPASNEPGVRRGAFAD